MAAKVRPAVVMSVPPTDTERALVTLVPHTTSVRGSRFEAETKIAFLKPGGFDAQSIVTVPFPRLVRPIGQLNLQAAGHDAATVNDEGVGGAPDPAIASLVQRESRALITLDLGFADIRSYPPQEYNGLVVLRLARQDKQQVLQ